MASYSIAAGEVGAHSKTLVAATADTVTFESRVATIEVLSDGAADIYFTIDGSTPIVAGKGCYRLPSAPSSREVDVPAEFISEAKTVVKLISSGTPNYSVARVSQ
jgi:hypothetical protein